ncbi:hypothetical protein, partial [Bradyrhizobium sp.]|uniref:hypothetical protein n=1 Tax=Bradyrhizobium sp. TaxID=376 RepID=UPI003C476148
PGSVPASLSPADHLALFHQPQTCVKWLAAGERRPDTSVETPQPLPCRLDTAPCSTMSRQQSKAAPMQIRRSIRNCEASIKPAAVVDETKV